MPSSLNTDSRLFGLGMNLDKTKAMYNDHIILEPIYVKDVALEVDQYIYFRQTLHMRDRVETTSKVKSADECI